MKASLVPEPFSRVITVTCFVLSNEDVSAEPAVPDDEPFPELLLQAVNAETANTEAANTAKIFFVDFTFISKQSPFLL